MKGLIASGHPVVSEAAAELLGAGGNAFDAAVGAGFASAVAEPLLTGLGGGGFLLARTAAGHEVVFDFFADTPGLPATGALRPYEELDFWPAVVRFGGADQTFWVGHASVAVPGLLKGLLHVHERLGRIPLAEVVAPAVTLARDGVLLTPLQASLGGLLEPILRSSPTALGYYATPDGTLLGAGDRIRNRELADFLETLPTHPEGYYGGDLADAVARDMEENGGLLTREDLERYRVVEREPLSMTYRGVRMITNPRPSSGGRFVALSLSLQEAVELGPEAWGSPRHLRTLGAVLREVKRIRDRGPAIPMPGEAGHDRAQDAVRTFSRGTTHLNVADAEGNVASLSTSGGEGSGVYVPGTGIMLNNMMGEDDLHPGGFHREKPGRRISSMMAPTVLMDGDEILAALGTGGSKRIRTALYQVITNLVDFGLHVDEAVNLPRIHLEDGVLHVEPGFSKSAVDALRGQEDVVLWEAKNLYFGGVHVVAPELGEGAGDRRRAGHALLVE